MESGGREGVERQRERKRRMNDWMVQWMDSVMEDEGSGSEEDGGMDKREGRSVGGRKNGMGMWVSRGDRGRARGLNEQTDARGEGRKREGWRMGEKEQND